MTFLDASKLEALRPRTAFDLAKELEAAMPRTAFDLAKELEAAIPRMVGLEELRPRTAFDLAKELEAAMPRTAFDLAKELEAAMPRTAFDLAKELEALMPRMVGLEELMPRTAFDLAKELEALMPRMVGLEELMPRTAFDLAKELEAAMPRTAFDLAKELEALMPRTAFDYAKELEALMPRTAFDYAKELEALMPPSFTAEYSNTLDAVIHGLGPGHETLTRSPATATAHALQREEREGPPPSLVIAKLDVLIADRTPEGDCRPEPSQVTVDPATDRIKIHHEVRCVLCRNLMTTISSTATWLGPGHMKFDADVVPICLLCTERDALDPNYMRDALRGLLSEPKRSTPALRVLDGEETDPVSCGKLTLVPPL